MKDTLLVQIPRVVAKTSLFHSVLSASPSTTHGSGTLELNRRGRYSVTYLRIVASVALYDTLAFLTVGYESFWQGTVRSRISRTTPGKR